MSILQVDRNLRLPVHGDRIDAIQKIRKLHDNKPVSHNNMSLEERVKKNELDIKNLQNTMKDKVETYDDTLDRLQIQINSINLSLPSPSQAREKSSKKKKLSNPNVLYISSADLPKSKFTFKINTKDKSKDKDSDKDSDYDIFKYAKPPILHSQNPSQALNIKDKETDSNDSNSEINFLNTNTGYNNSNSDNSKYYQLKVIPMERGGNKNKLQRHSVKYYKLPLQATVKPSKTRYLMAKKRKTMKNKKRLF